MVMQPRNREIYDLTKLSSQPDMMIVPPKNQSTLENVCLARFLENTLLPK